MIAQALLGALEWLAAALFAACLLATFAVSGWFALPALILLLGGLFTRHTARTTARRAWGARRPVADERGA